MLSVLLLASAMPGGADELATSNSPPDLQQGEATRRAVNRLAEALALTAEQWGGDAVALQANLLINSLKAGAVLSTEVKVVGPSSVYGADFLQIDVDTGLLLDQEISGREAADELLWGSVLLPSLERMETLDLDPAGLDVAFAYELQDFSQNDPPSRADLDGPTQVRTLRYRIEAGQLRAYVARETDAGALRAVLTVTE
ncbi:MAG: hypothetical protein H8E45_08465 [Proteobacteria bacterium]|nr:hypothetical protein [Pseudomonadota bacterium]